MAQVLNEALLTDELTGVYNRRYLNVNLPKALQHAETRGNPLSIFILDVDYFKEINDTFGHQTGDETLIRLAEILGETLENTGTVFRYAGDEFGVILPDTGNEQAIMSASIIACS